MVVFHSLPPSKTIFFFLNFRHLLHAEELGHDQLISYRLSLQVGFRHPSAWQSFIIYSVSDISVEGTASSTEGPRLLEHEQVPSDVEPGGCWGEQQGGGGQAAGKARGSALIPFLL